jgi:protoporphyrin/coproporphyrin ferrochelatase
MEKIAIILFNLGGPDGPEAVKPFLFNLFHDPAIIRLGQPWRYLLAKLIASRRASVARDIYAKIGGSSPILKNTRLQARALEDSLNSPSSNKIFKCFVTMRYWHPFALETGQEVKDFSPHQIVLLPLYPQFSTTTTASSLQSWHHTMKIIGLKVPTKIVCCYPEEPGFITTLAAAVSQAYAQAKGYGHPRILFSAHGLPEKIVKAGDPYQWQCEQTATHLVKSINVPNLDWVLCYQSRVGPLRWIGPSTDEEIKKAGRDRVPVVVVPIAFVSEHSETLVEIDMEYRHLAQTEGVPFFAYAPTVGAAPEFIKGLAEFIQPLLSQPKACTTVSGKRLCPELYSGCPCPL